MRDIGEAVGVSAVTVSKALAGKPGMSERIREQIRRKAEELGYEYPGAEKAPVRPRLDVGILIPDRYFGSDSFYAVMYKCLVQKLSDSGHFGILELLSREAETALETPNLLRSRRVNGMILLGQPMKEYYRMIGRQDVPVVFLDFYDEQGSADAVVGDNAYGCYRLTSHLIRNGHTKIGFVGNYRATSSIMDRYLGYYRAMLAHNLPVREDWILADRDDEGMMMAERIPLPEELPTAFVCNCDLVAGKLMEELKRKGLRIPEDISVTGFDDYSGGPGLEPALSTFRVNMDGMIDLAVKTLENRCTGQDTPCGRTVISGQPVYRASERPL